MAYLRPDEKASLSAQERSHEWNKTIKKVGTNTIKIAASLGGAGALGRILPFLSDFISPETALKGIQKVSPKLANFLQTGMQRGLALKEGLEYLKSQLEGRGEKGEGQEVDEEEQMQTESPQAPKAGPLYQGTHGPVLGSIRGQLQGQRQPQAPQPKQQAGAGQQALMQILQQIAQARQG